MEESPNYGAEAKKEDEKKETGGEMGGELGASLSANNSRVMIPIDTSHKYTDVHSTDYIGPGNAHHVYVISRKEDGAQLQGIEFQNGPIKEAGVNGVMDENLIAIVIDRLEGFQSGPYACQENADAKACLEAGLQHLQLRTARREARDVEGTHII